MRSEGKMQQQSVMGFDRFARTCSWNFFNPENRLFAQVRGSQFYPMNTFLLITYFGKPLTDLLLTFNSEKQD